MQKPAEMNSITLFPAERADIIVDFSPYEGERIILKNDLGPNPDPEDATGDIMEFRVSLVSRKEDKSRIPGKLSKIGPLTDQPITTVRYLKLVGRTDEFNRPLLLLNNRKWADPVSGKPRLGTTEVWSIINTTNFSHPIHIHLIQFQVLDRRTFNLNLYNDTGQIIFTGPAVLPVENERGWKDTVNAPGGQVTRLIMRFAPFAGTYVWHCHILEHEDYDMMRPLNVVKSAEDK